MQDLSHPVTPEINPSDAYLLRYQRIHDLATPPQRRTPEAIGYDLASAEDFILHPGELDVIGTGLCLVPPPGTYIRIASRSGLVVRKGLVTLAGVIDRDYRGEVKVVLQNVGQQAQAIYQGDFIAQAILERAIIVPAIEATSLTPTRRGTQGFGSTDDPQSEQQWGHGYTSPPPQQWPSPGVHLPSCPDYLRDPPTPPLLPLPCHCLDQRRDRTSN